MPINTSGGRGIRVVLDYRNWVGGINSIKEGYSAMQDTLTNMGVGVVVTSQRKKLRGEPRKPPHGAQIANILRSKGKDPFKYDEAYLNEVTGFVSREVRDLLMTANRTGKPRTDAVKRLLKAAAIDMADRAKKDLDAGKLGKKKVPRISDMQVEHWMSDEEKLRTRQRRLRAEKWYFSRLRWLQNIGVVTKDHGFPPPYGIYTARFWKGIKGTWKLGRRAK